MIMIARIIIINGKNNDNNNNNDDAKKNKKLFDLNKVFHALLQTAAWSPQRNTKPPPLITIQPSLSPNVLLRYEVSKVGKLRMFWNF